MASEEKKIEIYAIHTTSNVKALPGSTAKTAAKFLRESRNNGISVHKTSWPGYRQYDTEFHGTRIVIRIS